MFSNGHNERWQGGLAADQRSVERGKQLHRRRMQRCKGSPCFFAKGAMGSASYQVLRGSERAHCHRDNASQAFFPGIAE